MSRTQMLKHLGVIATLRALKRSQADAELARARQLTGLTTQQYDAAEARGEEATQMWQAAIGSNAGFHPLRADAFAKEVMERRHEAASLNEDLTFHRAAESHKRAHANRMQAEFQCAQANLKSAQKTHLRHQEETAMTRLEELVTQRSRR